MRRTAFSLVLLLLAIGCNDGTGPPLSSLSFVTTDITLSSLGENYQLKLSAKTAQGEDFKNPKITWTSTDPGVATVSETGLVTSVTNGSTEISVHSGTLTAKTSVVVAQTPATIDLSAKKIRFENIGDTAQIFVVVQDALGSPLANPTITWASDNPSVASVSGSGIVTAINLGQSSIIVQTGTISVASSISVSHWDQLTPGYKMTCGIRTSEEVFCWGNNEYGQVGDGTSEQRNTPTPIDERLAWNSINSMVNHSCGILSNRSGACWGNNEYGQVGDGTSEQRNTPTPIDGGHLMKQINGGFQHTCLISVAGTIKCWGRSNFGQLGDGSTSDQSTPNDISLQLDWDDLTAGSYHTCATTTSGEAYCWGLNQFGQLGNGTTNNKSNPVPVSEDNIWTIISAGLYHTCGINQSGEAYCWGLNDEQQLGSDRGQSQWPYPDKVKTANFWVHISAGRSHSCGLNDLGKAFCWGSNEYGQLGDSSQTDRSQPVPVSGDHTWHHIEAGTYHTCGVTTDGSGYCWGNNEFSQLGVQTGLNQLIPKKLGIGKY